jgi:Protein of unknown function (DUF2905)
VPHSPADGPGWRRRLGERRINALFALGLHEVPFDQSRCRPDRKGTRAQPIVRSLTVSMSRLLIALGLIILLIGITWPWLSRLGLGRLPGDIVIERENFHFYFPLATSIIFSLILSAVLWLLSR